MKLNKANDTIQDESPVKTTSLKEFLGQIAELDEDRFLLASEYEETEAAAITQFIRGLEEWLWKVAPRDKKGYPPLEWMNASNEIIKCLKGDA